MIGMYLRYRHHISNMPPRCQIHVPNKTRRVFQPPGLRLEAQRDMRKDHSFRALGECELVRPLHGPHGKIVLSDHISSEDTLRPLARSCRYFTRYPRADRAEPDESPARTRHASDQERRMCSRRAVRNLNTTAQGTMEKPRAQSTTIFL